MSEQPYRIELLTNHHDRQNFHSGSEPLDRYLHRQVKQDVRRHLTACFVAVDNRSEAIAGYYTLSATSMTLAEIPEDQAKRLPSYPHVPAALLGRLAISKDHNGKGLGGALLLDALQRSLHVDMAVYAMLVEAKDSAAQTFYEHHGFIVLPSESQHRRLMLPMATARKLLER